MLGPAEVAAVERLLRALRPAGLAPARLRGAVAALWQFVGGLADEEWWTARSARPAELAPDFADRFPLLTGLAILLDGIAAGAVADPCGG